MPREPYERPAPRTVSSPSSAPRTAHVDYLLRFVIERSTAVGRGIGGRLDALERTLVALTLPWRANTPLAPARELRLSGDTLESLVTWLEGSDAAEPAELERLGVYASGALTDASVPEGWVRIRLGE